MGARGRRAVGSNPRLPPCGGVGIQDNTPVTTPNRYEPGYMSYVVAILGVHVEKVMAPLC